MTKIFIYNCWLLWMCLLAFSFSSCKENEEGGTPVIYSVRVTDPAKADSTFTDANPGQMIVIQGQNLDGALKVYINDQSVSFNSNFNTSTHLITTIPSDLELHGENPEIKNEIRVVTGHGEAVFDFHVLSPAPSLTYYDVELTMKPDGTYEVLPGQELTIYGENFYEVERVYLTNVNPLSEEGEETQLTETAVEYDVTSYSVSGDYKEITAKLPQSLIPKGYLVVKCYSGVAAIGFSTTVPKPEITALSSDMPISGTEVTIYGKNLYEVIEVDVNGEYTIPVEELKLVKEKNKATFILPKVPEHSGRLTIKTKGGSAGINFYPYEGLVLDFDTTPYWWSWGDSEKTELTGQYVPELHSGKCYGVEGIVSNQWWFGVWNFGGVSFPAAIPGTTQLAKMELRFECYVAQDFHNSKFMLKFSGQEVNDLEPVDIVTGRVEVGKWITCSVPLSKFASASTTYSDFSAKNTGEFVLKTSPAAAGILISIYFDNFRFVVTK